MLSKVARFLSERFKKNPGSLLLPDVLPTPIFFKNKVKRVEETPTSAFFPLFLIQKHFNPIFLNILFKWDLIGFSDALILKLLSNQDYHRDQHHPNWQKFLRYG